MSDGIDKKRSVWFDVFTDSVDIHDRAKKAVEEKSKVEKNYLNQKRDLEHWKEKKIYVKHRFQNSTLTQYLEKTIKYFMTLPDLEKRRAIRKIFSKIVIDLEKRNQILLYIRPDPLSSHCHAGVQMAKKCIAIFFCTSKEKI
jgi:hypothetical protein